MIINIRIGLFFPPEQSFTNFSKIINIYNLEKKKTIFSSSFTNKN